MNHRQREISPVRLSDSPLSPLKAPNSAKKPPRPSSTKPTTHGKSKSFEDEQQEALNNDVKQISKPCLKINVQDVTDTFKPITSAGGQSSQMFKSCISRGGEQSSQLYKSCMSRGSRTNSRDFENSSNVSSSLNSINYTNNDNVKVCVRVRPFNEREKSISSQIESCLEIDQISNTIDFTAKDAKSNSSPNKPKKQFSYDFVANENIDQEQFFEIAAKPIVDSCLNGMNGSIFAYGQTGAGKTYTIQGHTAINLDSGQNSSKDRGILQRSFEHIFAEVESRKQTEGQPRDEIEDLDQIFSPRSSTSEQFTLKCSFFEIYNEQIIDLLRNSPKSQGTLKVQETKSKDVEIQGITFKTITKYEDVIELITQGTKMRHVGETKMNSQSSRSHSVLSTFINSVSCLNGVTSIKKSTFHIIDLAGSERNKDTQAKGDRLKEAGQINKSLSALGNVIKSLSQKKKELGHVPYRSSKLTFILKNSLGGNSKTLIIANISPSLISQNETISTLEFAKRAKMMRNQVIVNEDFMTSSDELKKEIERLKLELHKNAADREDQEAQTGPFYGCDRCYNIESNRGSSKEEQDLYIFSKSSVNDLQCKEVVIESLNYTEEDEQQPFNEISDFNELQLGQKERRYSDKLSTNKKLQNFNDLRLTIGPSPKVMKPPMHTTKSMASPSFVPSSDSKKVKDFSKSPMGFQLGKFFNLQNIQEELDSVNQELKLELKESQDQQSAKDDQYQELLNKFINIEKANQDLKASNHLLEEENKELASKFIHQSQTIQGLQKEKLDKNADFEQYESLLQKENEQIKLQMQHKSQDFENLQTLMKKEKEAFQAISKNQQGEVSELQERIDSVVKKLGETIDCLEDKSKQNELANEEVRHLSQLLQSTQKDLDVQEELVKKFKEKEKKLLSQIKQVTNNSKIYQEKARLLEEDKKDLIQKNSEFVARLDQLQKESADLRNEVDQKEIVIEQLRGRKDNQQSESSANAGSNLAMSFLRDELNSSAQNQGYMSAQKNKNSGGNSSRMDSVRSYERSFLRQSSPGSENFSQISRIDQIKSTIKPNETILRDYNLSFLGNKNISPQSPLPKDSIASSNEKNCYIPYRDVHVIDFETGSAGVPLRQSRNHRTVQENTFEKSIPQHENETVQLETSQKTISNKQNTRQTYQNCLSNQYSDYQETAKKETQLKTKSFEFDSLESQSKQQTAVKQQLTKLNLTPLKQGALLNNISTVKKQIFVYNKATPSNSTPATEQQQFSEDKDQTQKNLNQNQTINQTVIISNEKINVNEIQVMEVTDEDTSQSKDPTENTELESDGQTETKLKEGQRDHHNQDPEQDSQDKTLIQSQHQIEKAESIQDNKSDRESLNSEGITTVIIDDFSSPIGNYDEEPQQKEEVSHFQLVEVMNEQSVTKSPSVLSSRESTCHNETNELKIQIEELNSQLQESQKINQQNMGLIESLNKRITLQENLSKNYYSNFQKEVKQSQLQSQIYLKHQQKFEMKFKDILSEKASLKKELFELQNRNYNLLIENQNFKVGHKISEITSRRSVKTITPKFGIQTSNSFLGKRGLEGGNSRESSNKSGISKNNISKSVCSYDMEIQPKTDRFRIQDIQDEDHSACGYKTERYEMSINKNKGYLPRHLRVKSGHVNLNMTCENPMRVSADFSRKSYIGRNISNKGNSATCVDKSHNSCCQSIHSYKEDYGCKLKQWTGQPLECQSVPYQETDMRF